VQRPCGMMRRSISSWAAVFKQYWEIVDIPQNLQADGVRRLERVPHRLPSLLSHIEGRRVARTCDESGQPERKLEWG
jgi:hypothetical protein